MREILAEIGVEGLDPFGSDVAQLAGTFAAGVEGAEGQQVSEEAFAQIGLDPRRHLRGADLAAVGGQGAPGDDEEKGYQERGKSGESGTVEEGPVDDLAEGACLDDCQHASCHAQRDRQRQGEVGSPGLGEQLSIEFHAKFRQARSRRSSYRPAHSKKSAASPSSPASKRR